MHINIWQCHTCIKFDLRIRGCEVVDWIRLAQCMIEWQGLVKRVMNLSITHKAENYEGVSGSKSQINALAAQRLRVLMEAVSGKYRLPPEYLEMFIYIHVCIHTHICILVKFPLKIQLEILTFRTLVGFPSDDTVLYSTLHERRF